MKAVIFNILPLTLGGSEFFLKLGESLEKRVLGIKATYFLELAIIILFFILLYLIVQMKLARASKKVEKLEKNIEEFREEINLQIASIKVKKIGQSSSNALKSESEIETTVQKPVEKPLIYSKTAKPDVPSSEEDPETFFESAISGMGKKNSQSQAAKDSPNAIHAETREIKELVKDLDDASNPLAKSNPKTQPSVVVGSDKVSWDEKTVLKPGDEVKLDMAELIEEPVVEKRAKGPRVDFGMGDSLETDSESTKIDSIDSRVAVGTDEISIDLGDDEPHKTIDAKGVVEERRGSSRVEQVSPVELVFDDFTDFIKEASINISKGGLFIKSENCHSVGTRIMLDIKLKDGYKLIKGEGEVIRTDPPSASDQSGLGGMGIKFISLDEESTILVQRIVDQKKG